MHKYLVTILVILGCSTYISAQSIVYSPPQTLPYGINNINVLGYSSSGLLVREWGRNAHYIECFKSDLTSRWKKELVFVERNVHVEDVLLQNDTLIALYSHYSRGYRILKINIYNSSLNIIQSGRVIDTINYNYDNDDFVVMATTTFDRNFINVYYAKSDFDRNPIIYQCAFSNNLNDIFKSQAAVNQLKQPDLAEGIALGFNHNLFVTGDFVSKNYQNDFIYSALNILINQNGNISQQHIDAGNVLLGKPLLKRDLLRDRVVLCGLYAESAGVRAAGTYYLSVSLESGLPFNLQFLPFTETFIANLAGTQQVKKSDGVNNFKPTHLLVKKDGGVIFFTESQWRSTEYIGSPGIGAFGISNTMLVTYFHFNEIIAFSLDSTGAASWYQILRKKQASDNDNGFYLSYGLFTGADKIYLFYNDRVLSQQTLSAYVIDTDGNNRREEFFDSNKKNLSPIPKMSKQISLDEFVIPSFRRGFFQLIKITLS